MSDIFLSYSRDDQATARRFAEGFEREGLSVWWDQTLKPGEAYDRVTEKALQDAKAVVVLWSKKSVESHWVRSEATQAQTNGTLVPVMIEPCKRPIMFELMHTAELAHWKGEAGDPAWKSFLGDVRQFVRKEGAAPPAVVQTVPEPRSQFGLRTLIAVVALLVVAASVFWLASRTPKVAPKPGDAVAASPSGEMREVTLAVLPFADYSTAHDQESFCDGLSEEILNQLAQVKGLTVTARTSSFSFKGKNEDMRVIAQKLGVANLLEGSIQKEGNQLRVTAQLINGKSGTHMWSKTYARERKDIFAVQEEIAKDVAQAMSIRLDVGDSSLVLGGTTNVDAYERYLQARGLGLKEGNDTTLKSIRLLREAVAFDPDFSRAWLALGSNLGNAAMVSAPSEIAGLQKERDAAIERGMSLAPDGFAAQSVRIGKLVERRRWSEADTLYSTAARTGLAGAKVTQVQPEAAAFLTYPAVMGRLNEVIDSLKGVAQVEPLSLLVSASLQMYLTAAGDLESAQAEYERSQTLVGNHQRANVRMILRLLYQGATPQAVQERYRKLPREPGPNSAILKDVVESLGDRNAALVFLRKALADPDSQNQAQLMTIYQLVDALGDKELALAALHRLVTDQNVTSAIWMAPHSGIRADPEFKLILRETGLADYFRASGNWGDFCSPVGKDDFECH